MKSCIGRFDAIIAGGGVYGILLALEGAARGQRVLLLERDDFGGGTTFNHLRTIHGGLRYLQSLDIRRAVNSNRQRLWWLANFPDLVDPLTCLMPLCGRGLRRRGAFRAAFALARQLGLHRDCNGQAGLMRIAPTDEVRAMLPYCRMPGLHGGALWQDAFMPRPQRLVAELVHWAESAGAMMRNRTEVVSAEADAKGWLVVVRDGRSGDTLTAATRWFINAAGPAAADVIERVLGRRSTCMPVPTLAWNLLFERLPLSTCSVAVAPPDDHRRTWFLHSYNGYLLAGTGHAAVRAGRSPSDVLPDDELETSLSQLNRAMPGANLELGQVRHVFLGILPGVRAGSVALLKHPAIIDHGKLDGAAGAFTVIGVKFTEAPAVAKRVWDRLLGPAIRTLPRRPPVVSVPTIAEAQAMPDGSLAAVLKEIAAREWAADIADLVRRRTDFWMNEALAQRVTSLLQRENL